MQRRRELLASTQYDIAYMAENLVFTGDNYVDTGVYLYSEENINRDFLIAINFTGNLSAQPEKQATILNAMKEVSPYPGFVFRRRDANIQIAGKGSIVIHGAFANNNTIYISRHNGDYGVRCVTSIFDTAPAQIQSEVFDVPVTLGAGLNGSGQPFRHFVGVINRIKIMLF